MDFLLITVLLMLSRQFIFIVTYNYWLIVIIETWGHGAGQLSRIILLVDLTSCVFLIITPGSGVGGGCGHV